MSLKIHSVENSSKPIDEIVWIDVLADTSLNGYALIDRTFGSTGKISNEFRHIFVFPALSVKKYDYIRLSSGNGTYSTSSNNRGGTTYFLYWESDKCVWNNNGGDYATLINFKTVDSRIVPAVGK